jgi:phosphatidylglycerophosphatase A
MPAMQCCGANTLTGRLAVWLATGLGVGFASPAPGTVGGLWGIPLTSALARLPNPYWQLAAIALLLIAAVGVCTVAAQALGDAADPQPIVLDEIVVLPIVYLGAGPLTWRLLLAGYLLFRVCDVCKPGLVRTAERLPRGWGIVADDTLAAALAWAFLQIVLRVDAATGLHWLTLAA